MTQYTTHIAEILRYMEEYLQEFHRVKNIFLEFQPYKRTKKEVKNRIKALQTNYDSMANGRGWWKFNEGFQSHSQSAVEIEELRDTSYFNFINLHLFTHFRKHVERFGIIPLISTVVSELAHWEQIKECSRSFNKVDAMQQILEIGTRQLIFQLRLLNLKVL